MGHFIFIQFLNQPFFILDEVDMVRIEPDGNITIKYETIAI